MSKLRVFVSSVQKELEQERAAVAQLNSASFGGFDRKSADVT